MSTEYKFLRFESAGLVTIIYLLISLLPLFLSKILDIITTDVTTVVALIASIFLLSLPLGYIEHQIVVNKYRSYKTKRIMHNILSNAILKIQNANNSGDVKKPFFCQFDEKLKISFLTELFDVILSYKDLKTDISIQDRLRNLWSHFYARKAVGVYSPLITTILYIFIIFSAWLNKISMNLSIISILTSVGFLISIWLMGILLIDCYSEKIWYEINTLELSFLISEMQNIKPILTKVTLYLMEHPEYLKKKEGSISWEVNS